MQFNITLGSGVNASPTMVSSAPTPLASPLPGTALSLFGHQGRGLDNRQVRSLQFPKWQTVHISISLNYLSSTSVCKAGFQCWGSFPLLEGGKACRAEARLWEQLCHEGDLLARHKDDNETCEEGGKKIFLEKQREIVAPQNGGEVRERLSW